MSSISNFRSPLRSGPCRTWALVLFLAFALLPAAEADENTADDARAALARGASALESSDLERAESAYRQAAEASPASPWPWLGLAEVEDRRQNWLAALEHARRAERLAQDPTLLADEGPIFDTLARIQIRLGSIEQALATLERWRERQPTASRPYLLAALILRDVDRLETAIDLLRQARQADALSPEIDTQLTWMLLAAGRVEEARIQGSEALRRHGQTPALTAAMGLTMAAHPEGRDEAVGWLRRALERNAPEPGRLHLELGSLLLRNAEEADQDPCETDGLPHLRRAVDLLPDMAEAHYRLALGLRTCEGADAARASFERFRELNQQAEASDHGRRSVGAALNEVQQLARDGRSVAALQALDRLLAESPDDARIHLLRAKILFSDGQQAEAVDSARRARTLAPDQVEAHYLEGLFLLQLGRLDEARSALERALAVDPTRADAHGLLAALLADGGELEAAADAFRRAFLHGAEGAALRLGYAKVLGDLGRTEESARQMELYRQLSGG